MPASKPNAASFDHQAVARVLDEAMNSDVRNPRYGFALFTFEFGKFDGGRVNYVSNAERATMIAAVKEWLARAEGRVIDTEQKQ